MTTPSFPVDADELPARRPKWILLLPGPFVTAPATGIRLGCRERGQGRCLGRPTLPPDKEADVRRLLSGGTGVVKTAKLVGVGVSAVQRFKADMTGVA